jgi:hypothetical protein
VRGRRAWKRSAEIVVEDGRTLQADPKGEAPCPFCKGTISFPLDANGERTCVLHTLPACERYLRPNEDAHDFVKACNLEVAKRRGVGLS